jgi:hypothetical protein
VNHIGMFDSECGSHRPTDPEYRPIMVVVFTRYGQLQHRPPFTFLKGLHSPSRVARKLVSSVGLERVQHCASAIPHRGAFRGSHRDRRPRSQHASSENGEPMSGEAKGQFRSRPSTIPQVSFLFESRIRDNIDQQVCGPRPSTTTLWTRSQRALLLQQSRRKTPAGRQDTGDQTSARANANFVSFCSAQLTVVVLMRALVRQSKVLVLHKATSSAAPEIALIQRIVRSNLRKSQWV